MTPFIHRRGGDCNHTCCLKIQNLSVRYGAEEALSGVNLHMHCGQIVALIGPNGTGKSTLLKTILGLLPKDGEVAWGANVQTAFYEQENRQLNPRHTALEELWGAYPLMAEYEIRGLLGQVLIRGEEVYKKIAVLSGGERARIAILKLMLSGANMLLLDEPTNHLDISSCEALENALLNYDGTLFVISHDRYLINKLADRIYYLTPDGVKEYRGSYDAYTLAAENAAQVRQEEKPAKQEKVNDYKLKKERDSERRKLNTKVTRAEAEIEELDSLIEQKTNELSGLTDYQKAMELSNEIEELRTRQEQAMQTWEEASLALEEFDK